MNNRPSRSTFAQGPSAAFHFILKRKRYLLIFILLFLVLESCKETEEVKPQNKYLVSYQMILTRTHSELAAYLAPTGLSSLIVDDVDLYKVNYKTTYKSSEITASGLVAIPKTSDAVPIVSFQHGTITAQSEAPSNLPLGSTDLILYTGLAAAGFIAVVPDFIGFGASSSIPHPYYVEEATASAVLDMIQAARELSSTLGSNYNGKLFLAGYSQGGYATMAAHKSIEQNGFAGYTLVASFPAAGGYDIKGMQGYFFSLSTYDQPVYMAYIGNAYKNHYANWTQGLSDFFNEPYATNIPGLFNGTRGGSEINAALTTSIPGLVRADVLAHLDIDPKYQYMNDAFIENSLLDWKPTIRMFMYHGDADITVPYNNSTITYKKFLNNGADASAVNFITLPGANHSTGVLPYIQSFVPIMAGFK